MNVIKAREIVVILLAPLGIVAGAVVTAPLPEISKAFEHIDNADLLVKFILTSTSIGVAIGAPLTGYIMDRSGRRKLLIISLILYGISGSSGFVLNSLYAILAFRFLLGIAVSGIMTAAIALIADYYEGEFRSTMMGYSGAFVSFGGMISVFLGGVLAEFGWRVPFLLYLPTFVLLLAVFLYINEPDTSRQSIADKIIYPMKVMLFAYGITFIIQLSFYFIVLQMPFFMVQKIGSSPTEIGLAIAISNVLGGSLSMKFNKIQDKLDSKLFYAIIFSTMGIGILIVGLSTGYLHFVIGLMIMGIGLGLSMPLINLWLIIRIPSNARGKIIGGLTSTYFLARFLSPLIAEPFIQYGYDKIFIIDGIILLFIGLLFLLKFVIKVD